MTIERYYVEGSGDQVERWLQPSCPRCKILNSAAVCRSRPQTRSAMPMLSVPSPLLFWTLLLATLSCSSAGVVSLDPRDFAAAYRQADTSAYYPEALQRLENYDAMLRSREAEIEFALDKMLEDDVAEPEGKPELDSSAQEPLPLPQALALTRGPSKRTSYMALCHFKICNMGRKRNLISQRTQRNHNIRQ